MYCDLVKISSKGQIVIPFGLRKKMSLVKGSRLLLLAEDNNLLMRVITPQETGVFSKLISRSFEMMKDSGKKYKALWSALQRHNISDLHRII